MRARRIVAVLSFLALLVSCEMRPPTLEAPARTLPDAARDGDSELAETLIRQGADVNAGDAERLTPLHLAAFGGHAGVIRLLVSAGAHVNARDAYGFTPLHAAARDGRLAAVQALVECGAEVNATDNSGATPVQVALFMQKYDVVDYLWDHGATGEEEPAETAVVATPEAAPPLVLTGTAFRAWTSASGDRIEAEFVQCVMDMVTLRRDDGALVRIQLNRLSPADQVTVRELAGSLPPVLSRRRAAQRERPRQSIAERIGDEQGWNVLTGCRLMRRGGNDGDSFHVMAGGRECIFRLYYVDAAETSLAFPDRIAAQSRYFKLDEADILRLGEEARRFTGRVLSKGPFTVVTKWEDARGSSRLPRYYALVATDEGDLDELLVAEGLVRRYGMHVDNPLGKHKSHELKELEQVAKREKAGAWGLVGDPVAR